MNKLIKIINPPVVKLFFLILFTNVLMSQSLTGVKICINPGHGGHDSNDRFISSTGFWESEGNLTKGLDLRSRLEALGATVVMTRVENNTSDDLPLSQIVAIANTNSVDFFHSIHSNAYNAATNYTLLLFQGNDSKPTYEGAKTMGSIMVNEIYKNNRTTAVYNRGDFDFYGTGQAYLGVFKGLNMPGTLSEGSFHDYIPESYRLKNEQYLKHESLAILRSFLKYFNKNDLTTGSVAGLVRDDIETVPSGYSPIASKNDHFKTVNKIKITLQPGNLVYNGDDFNNGFFMFDNLAPGDYKIYYEADKYSKDSATVTVKANQTVFADKFLVLLPILDQPKVVNYTPADGGTNLSNGVKLVFNFDIRMNLEKTQAALVISPAVNGKFTWENGNKRMIFSPDPSYTQGTNYTVTLTQNAESFYGQKIVSPVTFKFSTRSKMYLLSRYPADKSKGISPRVMIRYIFDRPINSTSVGSNISFTDKNNNKVSVRVNLAAYAKGILEFEPAVPLNNGETYKLVLKGGISDIEYVQLQEEYTTEFTVEEVTDPVGLILDDFESLDNWQQPALSSITVGVKASLTKIALNSSKKYSGSQSMQLDYAYSFKNFGFVDVALKTGITLQNLTNKYFGIWVYGDNSKNLLEYNFKDSKNNVYKVVADTINWTGWKLKNIDMNLQSTTENLIFTSIILRQTEKTDSTGTIYFDAAQSSNLTDIAENNEPVKEFELKQNYPNPFNPSTVIEYSLPQAGFVKLKVFDSLGREITTLVNEYKAAGNYSSLFTLRSSLATGVYIYRLSVDNKILTKKMMFIK